MTKPTGDTMSPQLKQTLRAEWNMKWKAMVAQLANRINQPHVIDCYMRKVHRGGFDRGVEHVLSLPLASRLTAEEKERVRTYHKLARDGYWECNCAGKAVVKVLESIFGSDFFKEGE